jgi:MFS transporter, MHS family, alpha-ketoglutarate permease
MTGTAPLDALYPILTALQATSSPFIALLLFCGGSIFFAGYTSINANEHRSIHFRY